MRLWGRVVRALLVVFAAIFGAVALAVPEGRGAAAAALVLAVAGLLGVPALMRLFMRYTGDEALLEDGTPTEAEITSLLPTAWRYNRRQPIVRFGLDVRLGPAPYPVRVIQVVAPEVLAGLAPGAVVGVRVDRGDRRRVVIDWRRPIRPA